MEWMQARSIAYSLPGYAGENQVDPLNANRNHFNSWWAIRWVDQETQSVAHLQLAEEARETADMAERPVAEPERKPLASLDEWESSSRSDTRSP